MKQFLIVVLLCGVAGVRPSLAHTTGSDLADQCKAAADGESGARAGLCLGYINAYRELAAGLPDEHLLCAPDGVGNKQFIKILLKYLDQHPEKLHTAAAQLVYDSMQEAFPCAKDSR